MDLWIIGLLYKRAFGEKGLFRSAYPTGGMCGWSPALGLGVWRTLCLDE